MLRKWKLDFVELNTEGFGSHGSIDLDISDDYISIPAYSTKKKKFNRAKENREFKKRVEEELEWEW